MPTSRMQGTGWVEMDPLTIEDQNLAKSEINLYLGWLFGDIAKKPEPMTLRETASVVRYIRWLGTQGVPTKVISRGTDAIREYQRAMSNDDMRKRQDIERMAKAIWSDLLNFGQFEASTKRQAQSFFRKYAGKWRHPWLAATLEILNEFELPPHAEPPYGPPTLVGARIGAQGNRNPYLENDLSERIAAADYALERAGVRCRRALIAKALDQSKMTAREERWEPDDVRNRTRAYARQRDAMGPKQLANKWISSFRFEVQVMNKQTPVKP